MAQRFEGDGRGREGGRKRGTPNKVTQQAKEALLKLVCGTKALKQMQEDLMALTPYQRLQMQERLMQYVLPKMQSGNMEIERAAEAQVLSFTSEEAREYLQTLEREY